MNTSETSAHALRILIVDDERDTGKMLGYDLKKAFPGAEITSIGTVHDARDCLNKAYDHNRPFDIAILDFKLPESAQDQDAKSDFSLGPAVRELFPDMFIVHVTAFGDDEEIERFLRQGAIHNREGRCFVEKGSGWIAQVIQEITRAMHTRRVRQRFEKLFLPQRGRHLQRSMRRRWAFERCDRARSLAVSTLCDDASQHWEFLSKPLRRDLEETLGHAQDSKGNHYVGIVKERSEAEDKADEVDL